MSTLKIVDLEIYRYENIKQNINLFSNYIDIQIINSDSNKIKLKFTGENEEIYCKEFFNYLIVSESR